MVWNYDDYAEMNTLFNQDSDGYIASSSSTPAGQVSKSIKYVKTPEEGDAGTAWVNVVTAIYDIFGATGSGVNYIRVKAVLE